MSKQVNTKILLRNDLAANWTENNPVLGKGEIGIEIDSKKFKFGDGTTAWNSLPYGAGADIPLASASNDGLMSSADFVKLSGIESGAEVNIIETVKVNGSALTPDADRAVDVTVPTKLTDLTNDGNFVQDANYVHTDSNYTAAEKSKLAGIDDSADVNVIETVKVNGTALVPDANKAVDVEVPTKLSDLTNDANFVQDADYVHTDNNYTSAEKTKLAGIESGAEVNVQSDWSQTDSSADDFIKNKPTNVSEFTNDAGYITQAAVPVAATADPLMDGTAAVGTSAKWAKEDHVHPTDTSRAAASDLTALAGRVDTAEGDIDALEGRMDTAESDIDALESGKADVATTLAGYGITDAYTKSEVDAKVSAVFVFKGSKPTVADLPASGNHVGDVWHITADNSEYVWTDAEAWEELGITVSLDGYATEAWVEEYAATAAQGAKADSAVQSVAIGSATFTKDASGNASATAAAVKSALDVTKVEASETNGNIKIDGAETNVYTLPSTVLDSSDTLILNCGDSETNYV